MSLDFPASPSTNQVFSSGALSWTWDGQKWLAGAAKPKYLLACFVPGTLTAGQQLLLHRFSKAITFPANFDTYLGHLSEARASVAATASTTIAVQKATAATPGTFTGVGTIVIAAGDMIASSFTTSGGAALSFAAGDSLALVAPGTADATFAGFAATLVGYET